MKKLIFYYSKLYLLPAIFACGMVKSQTIIYQSDFENFTSNGFLGLAPVGGWTADINAFCVNSNYWSVYNTNFNIANRSLMISAVANPCAVYPGNYFGNVPTQRTVYTSVVSTGYSNLTLDFDWRCNGEYMGSTVYDYGQVVYRIGSTGTWTPLPTGGYVNSGLYFNTPNTAHQAINLPPALNNTNFQLGFKWTNDESAGYIPSFVIDNIIIRGTPIVSCNPITISVSKNVVCSGETVTLSANSTTTGYTYNWYTEWNDSTSTGTITGTGPSITVAPTQSKAYRVVGTKTGCNVFNYVTVGVSTTPTAILVSPTSAINCLAEVAQLSVTGGGIIPPIIVDDHFDDLPSIAWLTSSQINPTHPTPPAGNWFWNDPNHDNYYGSSDGTPFVLIDAYYMGPGYTLTRSSLDSPPISLQDYASAALTFEDRFNQDSGALGKIQISVDGGVSWIDLATYSTTKSWGLQTINLNTYAGNPYVVIRFNFSAPYSLDNYWAIDNVNVAGTPKATTINWVPIAGLYTDAAKITPYTGGNTNTVYASPTATTTYTVSAKTSVGCPSSQNVLVTKGDTDWNGATTNWNTASNWAGNTVPTADHCVNIPASTVKPVISVGTEAHAKNITIQPGSSLDIKGNLTVQDFVKNLGDERALILSSDANLVQRNAAAANSGAITAQREITVKDNNQYNYLISPLINSNLKTNIYENKTTGVLSSSEFTLYHNEVNNKFYTSSGAYILGRGLAVKEPSASVVPPGGKIYAHFTGVPMNGDFTYKLANSGTPTTGYNLVGNPYPSNIDIKKLYDDSPGQISEKFEFWDNLANAITVQQGSEYKGAAYAIFNAASGSYGIGNPAPGNTVVDPDNPASPAGTKTPNHIVKVGQGFMVRAVGAGVLNFKNTQRIKDQTDSNFYGKNQPVGTDDRYWLQLTTPSDIVVTNAIVYFSGGNNGFAKDDSNETGTSDALFTYAGTEKVVINGRNTFNIDDIVNLGTRNYTSGINKITLGRKEGIFENIQPIYLKDKLTGTITNLSEGAYTFSAEAGESTGRFEIVYKPGSVLATDSAVKDEVVVYRDGQNFIVKAKTDNITSVEIYDAVGRMIRRLTPNSMTAYLDATVLVNGTYILKIEQNNKTTMKKIIK